jgi:uncharacterized protein involved in tellurium resistance
MLQRSDPFIKFSPTYSILARLDVARAQADLRHDAGICSVSRHLVVSQVLALDLLCVYIVDDGEAEEIRALGDEGGRLIDVRDKSRGRNR